MHILYHHRTTAGDAQGIHIWEIVRAFRELGHTVRLVGMTPACADDTGRAPHASRSAEAARGPAVRAQGLRRLAYLLKRLPHLYELLEMAYNVVGLTKLLRAGWARRPDFIYERYSLFNVSGVLAARILGVPLVLEVNAPLAYEKQTYERLGFRGLAYRCETWVCNQSQRVVVVSRALGEHLTAQGVERDRWVVVPNGVNMAEIEARLGRQDIRERYRLDGKMVLGFVGWFRPWHRLDHVIRLLAARPHWRESMHLLLVGDGPEAAALRRLARDLGVAESVTITGAVGRDAIYDYIRAFDVALQPHVTPYASPMKIFEYLALGKCIVAPNLANIREIVRDGEEAILFRPGDPQDMGRKIATLAEDPERVRIMGMQARRTLEERRFYWRENAQRVLAWFAPQAEPAPGEPAIPAP